MEGFLFVFGRRKFTRYWCVLEGQQLSQYEDFDKKKEEGKNIKGVIFVKDAEVEKCRHARKEHVLSILPAGKKTPVFVDCGTASHQTEWFGALSRAAIWHETKAKRAREHVELAEKLGIPTGTSITPKVVTRAYRKLCLKHHPDKGGDVNQFNEIRLAYTRLSALAVEEEMKLKCPEIEYEAEIVKVPSVGLGVVVQEDVMWGRVVVKAVQDEIVLKGLSEEAGGSIKAGDSLYAIGNDVCSNWPVSRIKARLNNFRVPVNSAVRVTFARREPMPYDEATEEKEEADFKKPNVVFSNSFSESTDIYGNFVNKNTAPSASSQPESIDINKSDLPQTEATGLDSRQDLEPTEEANEQLERRRGPDVVLEDQGDEDGSDQPSPQGGIFPNEPQEIHPQKQAGVTARESTSREGDVQQYDQNDDSNNDNKINDHNNDIEDNSERDSVIDISDMVPQSVKEGSSRDKDDESSSNIDIDINELLNSDMMQSTQLTPADDHEGVVFKSFLDESLRDLVQTKSDLKRSLEREASLKQQNERLAEELADAKAQVRVLSQKTRDAESEMAKTQSDLNEMNERCQTLTSILEDRLGDMRSNDFMGSSATQLEHLAASKNDALTYKNDLLLATNNLAAMKLLLQSTSGRFSGDSPDSAPSSCSDAHHLANIADMSKTADCYATKLKKQLREILLDY